MAEVQSLLVPNDDSKVQRLRAEVQLLRFRSVTLQIVTSYKQKSSYCDFEDVTVQLSWVTAEVQLLQVQGVKFSYHGLREHTG
jgi:hypothetical protein